MVFYAVLAAAAAAAVVWALSISAAPAVAGILVGLAVMAVLFLVSVRRPMPARVTRILIVPAALVGVVAANVIDLDDLSDDWAAGVIGGFGGGLAGAVVGVVLIRRRLAHDDELLLRQQRLGFDPERPWSWLRG